MSGAVLQPAIKKRSNGTLGGDRSPDRTKPRAFAPVSIPSTATTQPDRRNEDHPGSENDGPICSKSESGELPASQNDDAHVANIAAIRQILDNAANSHHEKDHNFAGWEKGGRGSRSCVLQYVRRINATYAVQGKQFACRWCFAPNIPCIRYDRKSPSTSCRCRASLARMSPQKT